MKFTKLELKELAVEGNWLKRYSITTGRMVEPIKITKDKSNKKIVVDEAKSGIVYEGELTEMGESN